MRAKMICFEVSGCVAITSHKLYIMKLAPALRKAALQIDICHQRKRPADPLGKL
jgi:hypothetical protein